MTRVFELWRYAGRVLGNERVHLPPTQAIRGFRTTHDLRGKAAHFICVTHDSSISRADAIGFCDAIQRGRFKLITSSLEGLNTVRELREDKDNG